MSRPIAIKKGVAFAFPDVCKTPVPFVGLIPFPLVNIAQLSDAQDVSDASGKELKIGPLGDYAILMGSTVSSSNGDEVGTGKGIVSGTTEGECEVVMASTTVLYGPESKGVARFGDSTLQNEKNASGMLLSAFPTVLVGG